MENGQLQIEVSDGEVPAFIIDANTAVKDGKIKEAVEILTDDAIDSVRKIAERDEVSTSTMIALAKLLFDTDQLAKAEEWYIRVSEREPHGFVFNTIADICFTLGRICESVEYYRKAVEAEPDSKMYWLNLARLLIRTGQRQEGMEILRKRVEMAAANNDDAAGSILLWYLHHVPESTQQMFFEEYTNWGKTYLPISMAKTSHGNDPDPDRKLRIAYISPDFRTHAVSRTFEPFLDGHNRQEFEIYGYGNIARPDKVTERLKEKFDHYRDIHKMAGRKVAQLIEKDQIDILVEIGGHCRGSAVAILALKPAPVQVDLGGINTNGIEQIDYRITDRILTPPPMEDFYVEESVFLDSGFYNYRPPASSPLVGPLPAKQNGYVTFGSFNNNLKINSYAMDLWARVLQADEKSRFLMKFMGGNDKGMRDYYLDELEKRGVSRDRVDIYDMLPSHFEHLDLYNKVDIMLDTYPLAGCITTLEGLWMAVPTVSLIGETTLVSRVGLSLLSRVGLEIFTARTGDEYVQKAIAFASQLDDLQKIRAGLRQIMLKSDLCHPKKFTTSVEIAYRKMWRTWCTSHQVDIPQPEVEHPDRLTQKQNTQTQPSIAD
jgi:predicted O-linked N-acetylglucosamine transferase (SPINDLY family)